jgi:GMP synthase (glutamine-hydrolysing)
MDRKFLIVKNISREGPGLLEQVLKERGVGWDVVEPDKGQDIPATDGFCAMVVLGGPDSANDLTEKMLCELRSIRECLSRNLPYLGICLGMQALVKAAGGKVVRSPVKEVGFRDPDGEPFEVVLTGMGRGDRLFAGLGDKFRIFQLHGETVEICLGIELLGTGKWCRNQIVKVGECAYGIQGHFELTPDMLEVWAGEDVDLMPLGREALASDFTKLKDEYTMTGRRLFENFVDIACGSSGVRCGEQSR